MKTLVEHERVEVENGQDEQTGATGVENTTFPPQSNCSNQNKSTKIDTIKRNSAYGSETSQIGGNHEARTKEVELRFTIRNA